MISDICLILSSLNLCNDGIVSECMDSAIFFFYIFYKNDESYQGCVCFPPYPGTLSNSWVDHVENPSIGLLGLYGEVGLLLLNVDMYII